MARWRDGEKRFAVSISARLDPWARERGCARLDAGSECVCSGTDDSLKVRYPQSGMARFPAVRDRKLIQIVDAALADTARRSGDWLVCRPGCTQCCLGAFAINQLDALRLQRG